MEVNDGKKLSDYARKYAKEEYREKLTTEESEAVYHYTYSTYLRINEELRFNRCKSIDVNYIDKAINKFEYSEPITVYRMLFFDRINLNYFLKKLENGSFIDRGYGSTTIDSVHGSCAGNVRLVIDVPDSSYGAYIEFLSYYRYEKEYLLPRGTKYEVIDCDYNETIKQHVIKTRVN